MTLRDGTIVLNNAISKHHPNIWHFITVLIQEQAATDVTMQQIAAGQRVAKKSKKYAELNDRITTLRNRYIGGRISVMDMITGIGHNLHNFNKA